jgi:iron complex outermembrane receptor protein
LKRTSDTTPNRRFPTINDDQGWQSYADIAFTGDAIGSLPLEWKTGIYQLNQKIEANQVQTVATLRRDTEFSELTNSFGVFAEGTYELFEAFTLSGGIRYNWERKDFEIKQVNLSSSVGGSINSQNVVTWDSFTGFGLLRYDFTEEIGTYVKAGQFNPSRPDSANIPGRGYADPEGIDAFEWGLEISALAGRVSANTTFFFYNYDNYQVFRLTSTPAGVFREVQNARQARNYGAETELTFLPLDGIAPEEIEGLQITLRGGWLEATYVEFTNSEERLLETGLVGVSIDYSGRPLINSPNLQASGTITWPLIVHSIGTLTPQYDFTWTDDTPFDPNQGRGEVDFDGSSRFPPYLIGNRAYMLHNVRLSWSPPNETGIQVSGWCRNVTDERYKTFAVDLSTFNSQQLIFVSDPRTCGADFSFRW